MMYRVRDWHKYFETHDSRKLKRLSWVPMPNKHDGLGFRVLMGGQNGLENFACWVLAVQVASKCSPRGSLVDGSGRGLTATELSLKTGAPIKSYERALPLLVQIGWLEEVPENPPESPGVPVESPGVPGSQPGYRTGHDRTVQDKTLSLAVDSAVEADGDGHGEREKPHDANGGTATACEAWRLWVQVHGSVHGRPPPLDEPRMLRETADGALSRVGADALASAYRAFLQDGRRGKVSMPTYAMFWHPEKPATREHYLTQAAKARGDEEARAKAKRERDLREAVRLLNASTLRRVEKPDRYDFEAAYFEAAWEDFARRNGCKIVNGKWVP